MCRLGVRGERLAAGDRPRAVRAGPAGGRAAAGVRRGGLVARAAGAALAAACAATGRLPARVHAGAPGQGPLSNKNTYIDNNFNHLP